MARARKAKPSGKSKTDTPDESKALVTAGKRDDETGQFVKGHIGGPGRPKGSRNKLGEAFIHDMYEAWQTSGKSVMAKVIEEDPATFLRAMVQILPKEVDVVVSKYETMTDEQLKQQFIAALREAGTLGIDISPGNAPGIH